jgi:Cu2+-exporting ATPase
MEDHKQHMAEDHSKHNQSKDPGHTQHSGMDHSMPNMEDHSAHMAHHGHTAPVKQEMLHEAHSAHAGHGTDHTGHEQMFRVRFWWSLLLSPDVAGVYATFLPL